MTKNWGVNKSISWKQNLWLIRNCTQGDKLFSQCKYGVQSAKVDPGKLVQSEILLFRSADNVPSVVGLAYDFFDAFKRQFPIQRK